MKYLSSIFCLILILSACGNKSRHAEPIVYENQPEMERSMIDTATSIQEESPKLKEKQTAPVSSSSSSSHSQKSSSYDNMRGFDPASEDDMDDNGMSRYMENNDEEGWD